MEVIGYIIIIKSIWSIIPSIGFNGKFVTIKVQNLVKEKEEKKGATTS